MRQDSDQMEANSLLRSVIDDGGSWLHKKQPCEIDHYGVNQEDKTEE